VPLDRVPYLLGQIPAGRLGELLELRPPTLVEVVRLRRRRGSSGLACQDEAGRLWDVLTMLRFAIRRSSDGAREIRFALHVRNDNRERMPPLVRLKALCGPGDQGEPVVTVLMPDED
jgi:hypothetical protein